MADKSCGGCPTEETQGCKGSGCGAECKCKPGQKAEGCKCVDCKCCAVPKCGNLNCKCGDDCKCPPGDCKC